MLSISKSYSAFCNCFQLAQLAGDENPRYTTDFILNTVTRASCLQWFYITVEMFKTASRGHILRWKKKNLLQGSCWCVNWWPHLLLIYGYCSEHILFPLLLLFGCLGYYLKPHLMINTMLPCYLWLYFFQHSSQFILEGVVPLDRKGFFSQDTNTTPTLRTSAAPYS